MSHGGAKDFAAALAAWFAANKRALPFRESRDPYRVWLSEVLGQQTRMTALLPYYQRFAARFPNIISLAGAEEDEVLALWAGLGYYARARHFRRAAQMVAARHDGHIPADYALFRALPGVGDYTAGAVCSIAFGMKTPAVDGNVRRVYARLRAEDGLDPAPWILACMDHAPPAVITEALMELGALVCLPSAPHCADCPVTAHCAAYAANETERYPAKAVKAPKRELNVRCCLVQNAGGLWLLRRRSERLLRGMWEFPSEDTLRTLGFSPDIDDTALGRHTHVFTHLVWHMTAHRARLGDEKLPADCAWFPADALPAFPSAMRPFADLIRRY